MTGEKLGQIATSVRFMKHLALLLAVALAALACGRKFDTAEHVTERADAVHASIYSNPIADMPAPYAPCQQPGWTCKIGLNASTNAALMLGDYASLANGTSTQADRQTRVNISDAGDAYPAGMYFHATTSVPDCAIISTYGIARVTIHSHIVTGNVSAMEWDVWSSDRLANDDPIICGLNFTPGLQHVDYACSLATNPWTEAAWTPGDVGCGTGATPVILWSIYQPAGHVAFTFDDMRLEIVPN